jgi:uncharacterized protein (TIGR02147 family)
MNLYNFSDYKKYVNDRFISGPKRGRGQYRKLSEHLNLSTVAISQVFKGSRDLSPEQAWKTASFLLLSPEESEFFLLLVEKARAGTKELRNHFENKMQQKQKEKNQLGNLIPTEKEFSEEAKAVFYSDWKYSAIRLASSIPHNNTVEGLAKRLLISEEKVREILQFLLEHNLCKQEKNGYSLGAQSTMLPTSSPFINNHRRNWRIKALESMGSNEERDLHYSALASISKHDREKLRKAFLEMIMKFVEEAKNSPAEELFCLNLDWFRVGK